MQQRRVYLESFGIHCNIINEFVQSVRGELPVEIELVILDESRFEDALKCLAEFDKAVEIKAVDWQCSKCGEIISSQFTECWKCGNSRN